MNYDELVECLNVWFFFRCMVIMFACFSSKHIIFITKDMWLVSRVDSSIGSVLFVGRRVGDVTMKFKNKHLLSLEK